MWPVDPDPGYRPVTVSGHAAYQSDRGYPGTGRVYVASGSDNHLVVVDPGRDTVMERDPLPACDGAHGVQVDVPERGQAGLRRL